MRPKEIMLIAGEPSGDLLGAELVNALREELTRAEMAYTHDMQPLREAMHNVPATTNPLGLKGVGEAGTTAALAAVMNAVADAIPNGAGAHLDMPATAARLWDACRRARS